MSNVIYCCSCSAENLTSYRFCWICGVRLRGLAPTSAQTSEEAQATKEPVSASRVTHSDGGQDVAATRIFTMLDDPKVDALAKDLSVGMAEAFGLAADEGGVPKSLQNDMAPAVAFLIGRLAECYALIETLTKANGEVEQ